MNKQKQIVENTGAQHGYIIRDMVFLLVGALYLYFVFFLVNNPVSLFLQDTFSLYTQKILSAVFFFLFFLGFLGLIVFFLKRVFQKLVFKTKTKVDNLILDEIITFFNQNKYVLSLYFSTFFIDLKDEYAFYMHKIFLVFLMLMVIIFFARLFTIIFEKVIIKNKKFRFLNKSLSALTKKTVIVGIWVIGIITILSNLGVNVTALIAGAGIGGLAFAFAAQKSIANIFGAITILLNKPFVIGDYVTINGVTGTVKDLGLTYITLTEKKGYQVMIPNETIISSNVENYSIREKYRTDFSIGLVYSTTLEDMKKGVAIIENILETYVQDETVEKYWVRFDMFGDFSLNIKVTYFSLLYKDYVSYLKQKESINLQIKTEFETAGLDMAFPTQELILQKAD